MERIQEHVGALTKLLLDELGSLTQSGGRSLVKIYGPKSYLNRGGTVAFNLVDTGGNEVGYGAVEKLAAEENISIKSSCFSNPGAAEAAFGYTAD